MRNWFTHCLLWVVLIHSSYAIADSKLFLGPRDADSIKATIETYIKHKNSVFQYGNWYGPSWWGDVQKTIQDNKLPVDSLDIIAQRHSFAYQIAEKQSKLYGLVEEKRLKSLADYLAIRDAKALPKNPKQWEYPPADPDKAARYRDRMVTGFSYESPIYEGIAVTGKGLDWATSPIENWQLNNTYKLTIDDLEKQASSLQHDWNRTHLAPKNKLNTTHPTTKPAENNNSIHIEPNIINNNDKSYSTSTKDILSLKSIRSDVAKKEASISTEEVTINTIKHDPDYIELMKLTDEMMKLANEITAKSNIGKNPSNDTINKIIALQIQITALSKAMESKYAIQETDPNVKKIEEKQAGNTNNQGGTIYNEDGSKQVLHYEKDKKSKKIAVWTMYDKNGQVIQQLRGQ